MEKRICLVCKNQEITPDSKFCKICGSILESQKAKYDIIIRKKSTGQDLERVECNGAMFIVRSPQAFKHGELMTVGAVNMLPIHQLMSLEALKQSIDTTLEKIKPDKMFHDFLNRFQKDIMDDRS